VFATLREEIVPSSVPESALVLVMYQKRWCIPDQTTLVLVVHQVESVRRPSLLDSLDVFFESHLVFGQGCV
jgi:hypothetical protein